MLAAIHRTESPQIYPDSTLVLTLDGIHQNFTYMSPTRREVVTPDGDTVVQDGVMLHMWGTNEVLSLPVSFVLDHMTGWATPDGDVFFYYKES